MSYLGIDYGERRIGLAHGDELGIAVPITAAVDPDPEKRLEQIDLVIRERRVKTLVVGYPYNMDGSIGYKAREVDAFIEVLEKRTGLPVHRVDERLTSHEVENAFRSDRRYRKKSRELRAAGDTDSRAAALILQDYLSQQITFEELEPDWD
jgi:putative Holliday junction resolvase